MEKNYEFSTPALIYYIKEKVQYEFKFDGKERGSMYTGFRQKNAPAKQEVTVSPEMIEMQKSLKKMSQRYVDMEEFFPYYWKCY